jgi:hypothetical protein
VGSHRLWTCGVAIHRPSRGSAPAVILDPVVRRDGVRIAQRCWVPPEFVDDLAARCAAAVASCADDTVVCSTTAARLYGLWLPAPCPDVIHLAAAQPGRVSKLMTRTQRPEFRAHRRMLTDEDRTLLNGVPVLTLARLWVDLAAELPLADLVAAGDRALQLGCTREDIATTIARSRRMRGVQLARLAVPMLDERSRSRPESHLRVAASAPDLPRLQVNVAVYRDEGGWLAEPDLSLAEAKIALEYQGEDHADVARMRKDITRGADMRREGWACLFYGPAEVFGRPWQIAPELRLLIRKRARQLLRPR